MPWDSDDYVVTLTRQAILAMLNRYLDNEVPPEVIRDWAEELAVRSGCAREKGYQDVINTALYDLSQNPWLGLPLTPEFTQQLIQEITSAKFDPREND